MEQQPVLPRVYSDLIPAPYCTKKHRNQKPTDPKTAPAPVSGRKPKRGFEALTSLMRKLDEKSRFLVFCAISALASYCGVFFFRSLSLYGFDDPREAGFRLAGFVWAMRIIFAVGAVVSARVAGACFMG